MTTLTKGKDEGQRNAAGLLERTCGPPAQCFKIEVDDQPGCERGSRAPTHLPRRFKIRRKRQCGSRGFRRAD